MTANLDIIVDDPLTLNPGANQVVDRLNNGEVNVVNYSTHPIDVAVESTKHVTLASGEAGELTLDGRTFVKEIRQRDGGAGYFNFEIKNDQASISLDGVQLPTPMYDVDSFLYVKDFAYQGPFVSKIFQPTGRC